MKQFIKFIAIMAFIFVGFAFISAVSSNNDEKSKDRFAVEYCREQAEKDAKGDASLKQLLLGACDKMADDFKKKYGTEP